MSTTPNSDTALPSLDSLSAYLKQNASEKRGRSIPPLDKWHPERSGEMDLVIKANGEWWHEGQKITRQSLVDLFATVLWQEGAQDAPQYYLKTPVEKIRIDVEDVPFLIEDVNLVEKDNRRFIEFSTSTGDVLYLDDNHPLQMRSYRGEDRPYIAVRFGMLGLISRQVFMHLTKLGTLSDEDGLTKLTLRSGDKEYTVSVSS